MCTIIKLNIMETDEIVKFFSKSVKLLEKRGKKAELLFHLAQKDKKPMARGEFFMMLRLAKIDLKAINDTIEEMHKNTFEMEYRYKKHKLNEKLKEIER